MSNPHAVFPGDIVQITAQGHKWMSALAVVDEMKSWGVQAYIQSIDAKGALGHVYVRLRHNEYGKCGTAMLVSADQAKQRQIAMETAAIVQQEQG